MKIKNQLCFIFAICTNLLIIDHRLCASIDENTEIQTSHSTPTNIPTLQELCRAVIQTQYSQDIAHDIRNNEKILKTPAQYLGMDEQKSDLFKILQLGLRLYDNGQDLLISAQSAPSADQRYYYTKFLFDAGLKFKDDALFNVKDVKTACLLMQKYIEFKKKAAPLEYMILKNASSKEIGDLRWLQTKIQMVHPWNRDINDVLDNGRFVNSRLGDNISPFEHHLLRGNYEIMKEILQHMVQSKHIDCSRRIDAKFQSDYINRIINTETNNLQPNDIKQLAEIRNYYKSQDSMIERHRIYKKNNQEIKAQRLSGYNIPIATALLNESSRIGTLSITSGYKLQKDPDAIKKLFDRFQNLTSIL